ncbi:UNVERIFIED_CONTAM: Oxysterol-binding protein-related protein 2A [Sesamum latifolium]|uniref:Oxysterol-binding protein-related protein 2A n=1 Tax=Sesamum latifolium TaxID=2727402 RepID=A0AAW2WXQ3_9LAMI
MDILGFGWVLFLCFFLGHWSQDMLPENDSCISSFRESKSDDRRFYIFTATKTLHLRTNTKKERVAWIQALISTRSLFSLRPQSDNTPLLTRDLSISTERLKQRLLEEALVKGLLRTVNRSCSQNFLALKDSSNFSARSVPIYWIH